MVLQSNAQIQSPEQYLSTMAIKLQYHQVENYFKQLIDNSSTQSFINTGNG
jgi:hypothetical protein